MPQLSSEDNKNRRMFVGRLNPDTDDTALRNYFGNFGDILDYIIMRYPDTRRSKCFGFVTFQEMRSLEQVLESQPHYIEGAPVELKRAVPKDEMEKPRRDMSSGGRGGGGGGRPMAAAGSMEGRLFVGRLNYDTNDTVLRAYFERFGELSDNVIMRYPDTKRSKGFGFVTFKDPKHMEDCINSQPHIIDGKTVELQRATPREEKDVPYKSNKRSYHDDMDDGMESLDAEHKLLRKLFIGNLNYSTTEAELKEFFERYGRLEECSLMKFNDTGRSRGFAFLTYEKAFMVDDCQSARPHELGGKVLEVKRAAPKTTSRDPEALANVKKLWVGGFDDNMTDADIREYFGEFGRVLSVEQVKWHDSGKKRGFGFVEFDDHDPVDKIVLVGKHKLKGKTLEVKKALSKQEIAALKDQQAKFKNETWSQQQDNSGYSSGAGFSSGSSGGFGNSFMNSMGMMDMIMGMNNMGSMAPAYSSGYGSMGGGYMSSSSGSGRQDDVTESRHRAHPPLPASNPAAEPVISSNMEKIIMEKMNAIYENMAAITSMTGVSVSSFGAGRGMAGGSAGGGPVRGYSGGARESSGPYARTADTTKKHYGW